jgi:hypothetical protein
LIREQNLLYPKTTTKAIQSKQSIQDRIMGKGPGYKRGQGCGNITPQTLGAPSLKRKTALKQQAQPGQQAKAATTQQKK